MKPLEASYEGCFSSLYLSVWWTYFVRNNPPGRGIPRPVWQPRGPTIDIEAVEARIEVLVKKLQEDKKAESPPQLTEGTDSIQ
jgi:hypothetical protein